MKPQGQPGTGLSLAAKLAANCANFCTYRRTTSDPIMALTCGYGRQWPSTNPRLRL